MNIMRIKNARDDLQSVGCNISDEEKLVYVLKGLDETSNSIFTTLIEKMLSDKVIIDFAKALL